MDIFRNLLGFGVIMGLVAAINGNLILVGIFAMLALIGIVGKVAEKNSTSTSVEASHSATHQ